MSSEISPQTLIEAGRGDDIPHQSHEAGEHQLLETEIYEQLSLYPFNSDREFAKGLSIILGHPDTPASEEEISRSDDLVLQAKCYYFSRKEKLATPLNLAAYKSWLQSRPIDPPQSHEPDTLGIPTQPSSQPAPQPSPTTQTEPIYPTSFAHIVELITTGQPIPGIQQIPETVLEGHDAPSARTSRRKPWEKGESTESS